MCERGGSLGDDGSRLGGGQGLLGGQAAAWAQHGAMGLGMLQGMGVGKVQLWLGLCVLELKLQFELVHTGRPIMGKHLRVQKGTLLEYFLFMCFYYIAR